MKIAASDFDGTLYRDGDVTKEEIEDVFGGLFRDKQRRSNHGGVYPHIKAWKLNTGITNNDLAALSGLSVNAVGSYLRGSEKMPKFFIDIVLKLSGMTYEEAFKKEK